MAVVIGKVAIFQHRGVGVIHEHVGHRTGCQISCERRAPPESDQHGADRRRPQQGVTLGLVDETTDQEIDVDALHDALAVLLVRYHRAMNVSGASAE